MENRKIIIILCILIVVLVLPNVLGDSGTATATVTVPGICSGNDTSCGPLSGPCENCNDYDGLYGDNFCYNDDVYKVYRDYYCLGTSCTYNETNQLQVDCEYSCNEGACVYYTGGGGVAYSKISGLDVGFDSLTKYSGIVIPSSISEISQITFPKFPVKNIGSQDTTINIKFMCDSNNKTYCAESWCSPNKNRFELKSGETEEVQISCIIPMDVEAGKTYSVRVYVSNSAQDSYKTLLKIPIAEKEVIENIAKQQELKKVSTNVALVGGGVVTITLLSFLLSKKLAL